MPVFHVELNAFPKVATLFNQSGQQIGPVVLAWVQNQMVELDDEKWAPWESKITILEGREIPLGGLSMGRGWKTAAREGSDVTQRVLSEAREAIADGSVHGRPPAAPDAAAPAANGAPVPSGDLARDYPSRADEPVLAPAVALTGLLGAEPERLLIAWRAIAARAGGLAPSESLALAERELGREDGPQA
jgi:hypothetical protein